MSGRVEASASEDGVGARSTLASEIEYSSRFSLEPRTSLRVDPQDHEGSAGRRIPTAHQESLGVQALGQAARKAETVSRQLTSELSPTRTRPACRPVLRNDPLCPVRNHGSRQ